MSGFDLEFVWPIYSSKVFLSEGKRGVVYKSFFEDNFYLIKQRKDSSTSPGTIRNEFEYNLKVNSVGVGPKVYYYDEEKDFLIRDFVDGVKIEDWVKDNKDLVDFKYRLLGVLKNVLLQCRSLDLLGVNKKELTNPHKDILITKNDLPVIIDFERCRFVLDAKNVTQFMQYLVRPYMSEVLKSIGVVISKEEVIVIGDLYKSDPTAYNFSKVLSLLG